LANLTPNFGDTFTIEDWVFDTKGHKSNMSTHTVKIPKGSLVVENNEEFTNINAIANIVFEPETGEITLTRKDITDFKLKDQNIKDDTIEAKEINFEKDTLGTALFKLQKQLDLINGDQLVINSVDWKINNAVTELEELINNFIQVNNNDQLDSLNEIIEWIVSEKKTDGAMAIKNSIKNIEEIL
jgi:hypothetical protein